MSYRTILALWIFAVSLQAQSRSRKLLGPRPSINSGPQWVDYPAFSLTGTPRGAVHGAVESKKGNGKKQDIVDYPLPLFDILVEPEYIPDPFPVPYPYLIEDESDDENDNHNPSDPSVPPEPRNERVKPKYKRQQFIERSAADWVCPKGYIKEASNCIKLDQIQAQLGCAEGWKYNHGKCLAMDVMPPEGVCDDGYVPWDTPHECVKQIVAPMDMQCPSGFTATAKGCKKSVESQPMFKCEDGVLQNGKCRKIMKALPSAECPADFSGWIVGQDCFRELHKEFTWACPPFSLFSGQCGPKHMLEPLLTCPSSYGLQGEHCVKKEIVAATAVCMEGMLNSNAAFCEVKHHTTPTVSGCDPDNLHYNPLNSECEDELTFKPQISCPKGFTLDSVKALCVNHKTKEKKPNMQPPVFECPATSQFDEESQMCRQIISKPPKLHCEHGASLVDNICVLSLQRSPVLQCPEGSEQYEEGICKIYHTVAPIQKCENNYKFDPETHTCVFISWPVCEDGWTLNEVIQQCTRVERITANLQCPHLMSLIGHGHEALCQGEEITQPFAFCTVHSMVLEDTNEGPICKGIQVEPPTFECPPTFNKENNKCLKYDVTLKRALCPEGYTYAFDACVKEVESPPVVLCPEGYQHKQEDETCFRKKVTDFIPVCPEDMEFDPMVGECYRIEVNYDFDEKPLVATTPNQEALKDMSVPTPPPTTPMPVSGPPPDYYPYDEPVYAPVPPPQMTIIQQPVVIPQPAVILPQQAPVPPPPAIRVPYGVPQPVPTMHKPKHPVHVHHTEIVKVPPQQPASMVVASKAKKH